MFHFMKVFDLLLTDIYLPAKTTVKLTPDAFLEPSLYTEVSETEVRVKQLKDYISGDININPGLKVSKWWEYIKKSRINQRWAITDCKWKGSYPRYQVVWKQCIVLILRIESECSRSHICCYTMHLLSVFSSRFVICNNLLYDLKKLCLRSSADISN